MMENNFKIGALTSLGNFIQKTNKKKDEQDEQFPKDKKIIAEEYEIRMRKFLENYDYSNIKKCFKYYETCKFLSFFDSSKPPWDSRNSDLKVELDLINQYLEKPVRRAIAGKFGNNLGDPKFIELQYCTENCSSNQRNISRIMGDKFTEYLNSQEKLQIIGKILNQNGIEHFVSNCEIFLKSGRWKKK